MRSGEEYYRLKRKYKALKNEFVKVLGSWEDAHKQIKSLSKERAFLKQKLEAFLKTQIPQALLEPKQEAQTTQAPAKEESKSAVAASTSVSTH